MSVIDYTTSLFEVIDQHVDPAYARINQDSANGHRSHGNIPAEMISRLTAGMTNSVSSSVMKEISGGANNEWQTLAAISADLKKAETAEELATVFLKEILSLTDGRSTTFYQVNRPQESLDFWYGYPETADNDEQPALALTILDSVIEAQGLVYLSQLELPQHRRPTENVSGLGSADEAILLPMITNQREQIGLLVVEVQEDKQLAEDIFPTLQAIVVMAADVLNRASITSMLENLVAERTQELTAAYARLRELDELKTKFIQDISHEFRTPLTSIGLYLSLLEKETTEKGHRHISVLKRQMAQLTHLVDAVFDISKPERLVGVGETGKVDLKELLLELMSIKEPYAAAKALALTWEIDTQVNVFGNTVSLQRLVSNLIDNAVSYTSEGTIHVSLQIAADQACIIVSDTGMGIPEHEQEHIFDRFYRGTDVSQLDIPGTGLGLSMVKQIVEEHHGHIEVESSLHKGSTFRVWLPLSPGGKAASQSGK